MSGLLFEHCYVAAGDSNVVTGPYTTDVLTQEQIIFIAQQLPSPKATTGRPAYSNQELLPGILRVLRSGCRWRDLNLPGYPDGSTHWRRLRLWRKGLHFRWLWSRILKLLKEQNPAERDESIKRLSIDGTLLPSFAFKERSGYSGKHRRVGVKASIVVDATGLPLSVVIARGNTHDVALAENTVSHIRGHAYVGATMLADRKYSANPLPGFDHGVGHPPLLLCNTKAPNYRNKKAFKDLGHYSEWPKVADAVIEARCPFRKNSILQKNLV